MKEKRADARVGPGKRGDSVMYTIYVVFKCFPGKREAFVERVRKEGIVDAILAEDGCYRYDYYFSEKDPCELLLIEAWESQTHQQVHIGQPHMAKLRALKGEYIETTTLGEFTLKG
jgi:quinol monooxygenase YgiN